MALLGLGGLSAQALASTGQVALFEEDIQLLHAPLATLTTLRSLGVGTVRFAVHWTAIAPNAYASTPPRGFNAADPASYPPSAWAPYDNVVRAAQLKHIPLDVSLTGPAPLWATGAHKPSGGRYPEWEPSPSAWGKFVEAFARRYSGSYGGLPRIGFWEIWNEPNFGQNLAPQALLGSTLPVAPMLYRGLVDAAWNAFQRSGHGHDMIVLGSLDARGANSPPGRGAPQGLPGYFGATKPFQFIRMLYCVDSAYRQLRGSAAAAVGCPTTGAGSRRFSAAHPGLFRAGGFATHPYPVNLPPTEATSNDPDFTEFTALPRMASTLDRLQRIYGSGRRFAIYVNEYGYITNPPNHSQAFVSPATAAYYMNWAEYLSWRNPRLASTMQYLLTDPDPVHAPEYGGFASGLIFNNGVPKPGYAAYRLPIFLPSTSTRARHTLEVWGCARPAHYFGIRVLRIQFQRRAGGPFATLKTIKVTGPQGYFDTRVAFPSSGAVRLAWTYPPVFTQSYVDPLASNTVTSRVVKVTVRG